MATSSRAEAEDRPARTTLAAVAEAAEVSVPTVSKVLNGRPDVAPKTRERIERLLRDLDYVVPASRQPEHRVRTVAVLLDQAVTPYTTTILRGVVDAGWEFDADVIVGRLRRERPEEARVGKSWAHRLRDGGRAGAILVTSRLSDRELADFRAVGLPVVLIDPINQAHEQIPSIGATNWAGGLSATEHLLSLGHRRIGFVGGPVGADCSQERLHGYRAALERRGLELDDRLLRHGTFHYEEARTLGRELLDHSHPPTAIFASSDETAIGVMQAAYEVGLRIPDELSLVGFDDTSAAAWTTPPLTTVRAPLHDMARVALRSLLQLADGEELDSHHVQLASELVVRASTAAPRGS